ncbi:hypothetical protein ACYSNR_03165 [Enterococcus sp. LJL128]
MSFSKKRIKQIKHQIKNGKIQLKNFTVSDLNFEEIKEEMFQAALIDFLDFLNIKQDIHSFMAEAMNGNEDRLKIAQFVADELMKKINDLGIKDGDVKSIKYVNKEAYDSPLEFLKEEGLMLKKQG